MKAKTLSALLVACTVTGVQATGMMDMLMPAACVTVFAEYACKDTCATTRGGRTESMVKDACVATAAGVVSNMIHGHDMGIMSVAKEAVCQVCALAVTKSESVKHMLSQMPVFRKLFVGVSDAMCVQDLARYGLALSAVKAVAHKMTTQAA